jgi:NAD+ kinase
MEYNLSVDDEVVWRDYGDGVIISTPNGSTAYSMSAGGPMILQRTPVFAIVSINSLDVTRRPVVVSEASRIKIGEVSSDYGCVVVVDGTYRIKVKDTVEANKWFTSARLVRLPETSKAMDKMVRKVRLAEDLLKMPPSAKLILKTLEHEGPLTRRDLAKRTMLPDRTARMALALLAQRGLIKRKPLLRDPRHKLYYAS